ncbi:hypothetical protein V8C34DRAFT_316813 [Trichoderma compactum]
MYLEVDPRGDTLIILQYPNNHPSSPSDAEDEAASEDQSQNQFLVSKKHLMLASPRAGKAFEIVMKIFHGRTRYIPRKIDLALLSQITAIVDDLEYNTKGPIPSEICEDLMRWMLVSFVFEEPELFKKVTTTAIRCSTDVIPTFNLPIRPKALGNLKGGNIFSNLFTLLYDLECRLLGESIGCNEGCRAMLLGTLSQGLRSSSLSPFPSSPYISLSISSTLPKVKAIESLGQTSGAWTLYNRPLPRGDWYRRSDEPVPSRLGRHKCRLEDHLNGLINTTNSEIEGLELAKYLCV